MMKSLLRYFIRLQSLIIISLCVTYFLVKSYTIYESFLKKETGTRVSLQPFDFSKLEITLCPKKPYDSVKLSENGINRGDYNIFGHWVPNNLTKSPADLYNEISPIDFFRAIRFYTLSAYNGSTSFRVKPYSDYCGKKFIPKINDLKSSGKCVTLSIPR